MIAAPSWYAEHLGSPFVSFESALADRLPAPLRRLTARPGLARGLALGWLARRGCPVAVIRRERGSLPALWVAGLPPRRRRVFVLELIRRPRPPSRWRRALWWVWWKLVEAPPLRRGMAAAQVMTAWEADEYARHYGVDRERLHHVPWALCEHGDREPPPLREQGRRVFASGRTATDWETLFAAAAGSSWDLVAICAQRDLPRVGALAAGVGAEAHAELAWAEYDRLLRDADVSAVVLLDRGLSSGHARLMSAVEAGVPVVATDVPALAGYLEAGRTAAVVPPGDAAALRAQIDALLADPGRRGALRDAALARARSWTYEDYFRKLRALILAAVAPASPASPRG